jgi:hypothetical protein
MLDLIANRDLVLVSLGVAAVWLVAYLLIRRLRDYGEQK